MFAASVDKIHRKLHLSSQLSREQYCLRLNLVTLILMELIVYIISYIIYMIYRMLEAPMR
jgi:hypothetical protein